MRPRQGASRATGGAGEGEGADGGNGDDRDQWSQGDSMASPPEQRVAVGKDTTSNRQPSFMPRSGRMETSQPPAKMEPGACLGSRRSRESDRTLFSDAARIQLAA